MPTFFLSQIDAVRFLESVPNESIDLIITDPPYESLEKHRARGTTTRLKQSKASSNPWFHVFSNSRFDELFAELYRVLKHDRHFYLFCDPETMFIAKPLAQEHGFTFWKPLVWDKVHIGMGYHYRSRYEFILFFEKGKRRLKDLSVPDVLSYKPVKKGYPTEKPVDLLRTLIAQSSNEAEVVCDPFFGSGSTGAAAITQQCNFIGADTSEDALALARRRLTELGAVEVQHYSFSGKEQLEMLI